MKQMGISIFKAKCIGVLREVSQTNTPLIITRRGEALVRIEPITKGRTKRKLGTLKHMLELVEGDDENLVAADFSNDWEFEQEP